jgi:hypothetical protein
MVVKQLDGLLAIRFAGSIQWVGFGTFTIPTSVTISSLRR